MSDRLKFYLFLDDQRQLEDASVNTPLVRLPSGIYHTGYDPLLKKTNTESTDWVIARNFEEFRFLLDTKGIPDMVSFDHDLDHSSSRECMRAMREGREFCYGNVKEKTGLDCAKYLIQKCEEAGKSIPTYFVHSANPMGSESIKRELESYNNTQNNEKENHNK